MVDQTLDARRIAREQATRAVDMTDLALGFTRPFTQFNTAMLRFFSNACETTAEYQQKNMEILTSLVEQQKQAVLSETSKHHSQSN